MMSFFARGAPPAVLSFIAVATVRRTRLSSNIVHFTLPAAFLLFFFGLLVYIGAFFVTRNGLATMEITPEITALIERTARADAGSLSPEAVTQAAIYYAAQTSLVTYFVWTGVILMLFADPPARWFAGGSRFVRKTWLPIAAAAALIIGYYVVLLVPALRAFFELVPLPFSFHAIVIAATILWIFLQRWVWRKSWMEKFLDMPRMVDVEGKEVSDEPAKLGTAASPQPSA
jgi:hypothetical protein